MFHWVKIFFIFYCKSFVQYEVVDCCARGRCQNPCQRCGLGRKIVVVVVGHLTEYKTTGPQLLPTQTMSQAANADIE